MCIRDSERAPDHGGVAGCSERVASMARGAFTDDRHVAARARRAGVRARAVLGEGLLHERARAGKRKLVTRSAVAGLRRRCERLVRGLVAARARYADRAVRLGRVARVAECTRFAGERRLVARVVVRCAVQASPPLAIDLGVARRAGAIVAERALGAFAWGRRRRRRRRARSCAAERERGEEGELAAGHGVCITPIASPRFRTPSKPDSTARPLQSPGGASLRRASSGSS